MQARDTDYQQRLADLTNQYNEIYQRCTWKEQEVAQLKESLHARTASQNDSSQHLYNEKDELDRAKNEMTLAKRNVSSITKETNRLNKELDKIKSKRDEADAKIGMFVTSKIQIKT